MKLIIQLHNFGDNPQTQEIWQTDLNGRAVRAYSLYDYGKDLKPSLPFYDNGVMIGPEQGELYLQKLAQKTNQSTFLNARFE